MTKQTNKRLALSAATLLICAWNAHANEWPQWRGPDRTDISPKMDPGVSPRANATAPQPPAPARGSGRPVIRARWPGEPPSCVEPGPCWPAPRPPATLGQ